ncbi:DUF72 domain-containing protein [Jeotgalibaca sp. MA1X17-3]|uniref:DUF72 domain-containing protein n=1 Tax=Jeotgalibaca sp. MA1X17-3 TaxID=2908211 RepID=UPI001F224A44|nr:DUF72 domain-containing protein [Jeotgalibaca sp. MA1X17-3]UJF16606.1 DUF72 domain-containing protein [Jeotgalibaca sp. MA1X17-3]
MIEIGLTGWSDHPLICPDPKRKLIDYASHLPVVELDSSFYAIPPEKNITQWIKNTPETFQFIPKAYAPLTKHKGQIEETRSLEDLFKIYKATFSPMMKSGKIKAFLFQFPPTFSCRKGHVEYLRKVRRWMADLPIAIEFRNQSWYSEEFKSGTLAFLKEMNFIHVVVDQPQTPNNSVPFTPVATNPDKTFIRLHGRNYEGWLGDDTKDWRTFRTLYDYSDEDLKEIMQAARDLEKDSKEVTVIFNNNSGGHAAKNAKTLQKMLGIEFEGLAPQQLDLFL